MSNDNRDATNNKALKLTAILFMAVGVIALIFIIVTRIKGKDQADSQQAQESSVSENTSSGSKETSYSSSKPSSDDPLAGTYKTVEDYQNLVIDLQGQVERLRSERDSLQSQVKTYEAARGTNETAAFIKIRNDLAQGLELYHNISCNGAYEMMVKRQNYLVFIEDYLTENAYLDFFENGEVDKIVNGTAQYSSYEVTEETEYNVSRRIMALDVTCSDPDPATGTATYVIIYMVEEVLPFDQGTNDVWRINYGKCVYNAEKDKWQFDDIYMLKTFTSEPDNAEELFSVTGKQE